MLIKKIQSLFFWFCIFFLPHLPSQEVHWVSSMCALLHLKFQEYCFKIVWYSDSTLSLTILHFFPLCDPITQNHTKHTPAPVTGSPQQDFQPNAGGQFNNLSLDTILIFYKMPKLSFYIQLNYLNLLTPLFLVLSQIELLLLFQFFTNHSLITFLVF